MTKEVFPDPLTFRYPEWVQIGSYLFRSHDVVSFGTPLTVETVREAYVKGIFPWYTEGIPLPWHCPEMRAILEFDDLRIPRSLAKARRSSTMTFTIDQAQENALNPHAVCFAVKVCSLPKRMRPSCPCCF